MQIAGSGHCVHTGTHRISERQSLHHRIGAIPPLSHLSRPPPQKSNVGSGPGRGCLVSRRGIPSQGQEAPYQRWTKGQWLQVGC